METNEVSRGKKAWAITLHIAGFIIFLVGIRFGLIGGAIGGAVWALASQQARKINPKVSTTVNKPVKGGGLMALGIFVVVIAVVIFYAVFQN